jgi:hypothetical protein
MPVNPHVYAGPVLDLRCTRPTKDYDAERELCGFCWQNGLRQCFPYKGSAEVKEKKSQNLLKKPITVVQVALVVLGCLLGCLLAFAIASG